MSPELSSLFEKARGMAPVIPEPEIIGLQVKTKTEIEQLQRTVETWKALEQEARELAAGLREEQYGPSSEGHTTDTPEDDSDGDSEADALDEAGLQPDETENSDAKKASERCDGCKKPKPFPPHLSREPEHHYAEPGACACGGEMKSVGEPKCTEILCHRPESWYVRRDYYNNLKCSSCGSFRSARAPKRLVPGSRYDASFVIDVIVSKFFDYLPLNRQSRRLRRAGIDVDRATLARLVTAYAEPLYVLQDKLLEYISVASDPPDQG